MCLESKLNPRCRRADFGTITENCFLSWQAVSHSKCSVCLANVRPFLSSHACFALPCKRHMSWHQSSTTKGTINSWRDPSWKVRARCFWQCCVRLRCGWFAPGQSCPQWLSACLPVAQLLWRAWNYMDILHQHSSVFMVLPSWIYKYGNPLLLHCSVSKCCDVRQTKCLIWCRKRSSCEMVF